jgi:hypothetical protein
MAGVEEHDKGRHKDDEDMIITTTLPLLLLPANNLKKNIKLNWEDTMSN